ncbi:hypothetical protein ACH4TQ_44490 [Streptomyces sp. NPDC021218]|uniref:hypothetical protein n=1 Tax=Streptomyces sp. NPDC021218 TaxID=3365119 RepID=UPI0037919E86
MSVSVSIVRRKVLPFVIATAILLQDGNVLERLVAVDRGGEPVRMVGMVDETATHDERSLVNA